MARIFCWQPQLRSVQMDLQFLLDFMLGERLIGLKRDVVCGVDVSTMHSSMQGIDGAVFVVLDRWNAPVPIQIMDFVRSMPHMVIWHHDDLHLAWRYER